MHITELVYTRKAKINKGNYENEDIELTATMQLDIDSDDDEAFEMLKDFINTRVKAEVKDLESLRSYR